MRPNLKAIKRTDSFKSALVENRNTQLESELLGVPLWLLGQGMMDDAIYIMDYVASLDVDIFSTHLHRGFHKVYTTIARLDQLATIGQLQFQFQELGLWTDDLHSNPGLVTSGLLSEYAENGEM